MEQTQTFKPFCAVYAILVKNTKVLLLKRKNQEWPDGYFSLPAGHVNEGESVKSASSRVLTEQTGAIVPASNMRFTHVLYRKVGDRTYVDFFFQAEAEEYNEDQLENKQPDVCDGLEWFEIHKLPENILPHIRTMIIDLEQGVTFREFGWETLNQDIDN